MTAWVYILASKPRRTLYVGVTNDLLRRVAEHREGLVEGFTKQYGVKMLVYFEEHESIVAAIEREKRLKRWARSWKIDLIRSDPRTLIGATYSRTLRADEPHGSRFSLRSAGMTVEKENGRPQKSPNAAIAAVS